MTEHSGEQITRLHRELPRIKVWFIQSSIRLQGKCYIRVTVLVGAISKIKCWKSCADGADANSAIWMTHMSVLLYAAFRKAMCDRAYRQSFFLNHSKYPHRRHRRYTLEFGIDTFHKYSANAAQILPPLKKCVDQHIELAVNIFKKSGQMTRLILIYGCLLLISWKRECASLVTVGWQKEKSKI